MISPVPLSSSDEPRADQDGARDHQDHDDRPDRGMCGTVDRVDQLVDPQPDAGQHQDRAAQEEGRQDRQSVAWGPTADGSRARASSGIEARDRRVSAGRLGADGDGSTLIRAILASRPGLDAGREVPASAPECTKSTPTTA